MTTNSPLEEESPTDSYRPALVALTDQVRELIDEFARGFNSRRRLLEWSQRMTIRTLGELPEVYYADLTRSFQQSSDTVLLSALHTPATRSGRIDDDQAEELRERIVTTHIQPAFHRAFRRLRKDATEYVDEAGEGDAHDPSRQRHIAMRPALDELEQWQQTALGRCLNGLEDRSAIPDWGEDVELATHGEMPEGFVARCYREPSTWKLLVAESATGERGRELFAAAHLLPAFRDGVATLAGRAGETAAAERQESEVSFA